MASTAVDVSTPTSVRYGAPSNRRRIAVRIVGWAALVAFLLYLPTIFGDRSLFGIGLSNTATLGIGLANVNFVLVSIMGAVALNLLVGYTGLLSLGHSAFLAIGAMAGGLLGIQAGLPFWLVAIGAFAMGGGVGVVAGLPSMRVGGLYLLLSTFALNAIVLYIFLRYQTDTFGVAGIIYPIPEIAGYEIANDHDWFYLLVVCAAAVLLVSRNLLRTRQGRAFVAIRDHDVAAASCGVDVSITKLKSFAFTSGIVSLAGVLYAYYLTSANAETYTLELVIGYYAMIIIGGMGSLLGAVLGAMLWGFLPPILTTLSQEVPSSTPVVGDLLTDHRDQLNLLIFGLLIIVILIFMPRGLAGVWESVRGQLRKWPYRE
jgi:branched-chain amino acid transport system permease protein